MSLGAGLSYSLRPAPAAAHRTVSARGQQRIEIEAPLLSEALLGGTTALRQGSPEHEPQIE